MTKELNIYLGQAWDREKKYISKAAITAEISIGTNSSKRIVSSEGSFCLKNSQPEKMD